jgi:LPS export ABC transporter protein LptC
MLVTALVCCGCESARPPVEAASPDPESQGAGAPLATLAGVVFEAFVGEERNARVRAARAEIAADGDTARLEEVHIELQEPNRGSIEVRSPEGEFELVGGDFLLRGGVEGVTGAGERFSTDRLRYVAAEERLHSESPVRVLRSNLVLQAERMVFEMGDRRIRLEGRVSAEVDGR